MELCITALLLQSYRVYTFLDSWPWLIWLWFVAVSVCRRSGLSPFQPVAVLTVAVSVCRRFDSPRCIHGRSQCVDLENSFFIKWCINGGFSFRTNLILYISVVAIQSINYLLCLKLYIMFTMLLINRLISSSLLTNSSTCPNCDNSKSTLINVMFFLFVLSLTRTLSVIRYTLNDSPLSNLTLTSNIGGLNI